MTTPVSSIRVERQPSPTRLQELGVATWPIWSKEISTFPWTYTENETCYFLAGKVLVHDSHGESVEVGAGDLVTFPAGLSCTWQVIEPVRKHYHFH